MFVAAFIFVLSAAAMVHFAMMSWRAGLMRVAGKRLPGEMGATRAVFATFLAEQDFRSLEAWREICPDLSHADEPSFRSVNLYHSALRVFSALGRAISSSTSSADWAQTEMALCTRYAAVRLAERLERNRAVLADVTSH